MGTEALDLFDTLSNVENTNNVLGFLSVPSGRDLYRPKAAGPCSLIVLPYVTSCSPYVKPGMQFYMRDYFVFHGLGATKKSRYLDHAKTFKERCAITDSLMDYAGDPKEKPKSQRMALVNVIMVTGDTQTLAIMDFSYASFLGNLIADIKTRVEMNAKKYDFLKFFADPTKGVRIDFMWKEGSFNGHKFFEASGFDYDVHGGVEPFVKEAVDLDKMFVKLTYKQVQANFLGYDDDGDEDTPDTEPKDEAPFGMESQEKPAPVAEVAAPVVAPVTRPAQAESIVEKPKARKQNKKPDPEALPSVLFNKGDRVMFEGRECSVYKVVSDVITLLDKQNDDFVKVTPEQISKIENTELATAASGAAGTEENWDNWK